MLTAEALNYLIWADINDHFQAYDVTDEDETESEDAVPDHVQLAVPFGWHGGWAYITLKPDGTDAEGLTTYCVETDSEWYRTNIAFADPSTLEKVFALWEFFLPKPHPKRPQPALGGAWNTSVVCRNVQKNQLMDAIFRTIQAGIQLDMLGTYIAGPEANARQRQRIQEILNRHPQQENRNAHYKD